MLTINEYGMKTHADSIDEYFTVSIKTATGLNTPQTDSDRRSKFSSYITEINGKYSDDDVHVIIPVNIDPLNTIIGECTEALETMDIDIEDIHINQVVITPNKRLIDRVQYYFSANGDTEQEANRLAADFAVYAVQIPFNDTLTSGAEIAAFELCIPPVDAPDRYKGHFHNVCYFAQYTAEQMGIDTNDQQWPLDHIDWGSAGDMLMQEHAETHGEYFEDPE